MARNAMRAAAADGEKWGRVAGAPRFLTYEDDSMGWVRIPWHKASIEHLRWFAAYRRQQADEMLAVARRVEGVLDQIERAHQRYPERTRLIDLSPVAPNPRPHAAA